MVMNLSMTVIGSGLAFLAATAVPAPGRADQLQCLSRPDAERAVATLPPGAVMVDFCSKCTGFASLVRVDRARAIDDCNTEVEVTGTVVARSTVELHEAYPKGVRYRPMQESYSRTVDLAYVYVETAPNRFDWLGGVLRLRATVNVPTIVLPQETYAALGDHPLPAAGGAAQVEAPQQKIAAVKLNWFAAAGIKEIVAAHDSGDAQAALAAADRALDAIIAQTLAKAGLAALAPPSSLRQRFAEALNERLSSPYAPLRNVYTGHELRVLEELPTQKLEQVMAVLALWGALTARASGQGSALDSFARALVADPTTLADCQRRAPRAAALARFYAALYRARFDANPGLEPDERLLVGRLAQYFGDEKAAFKGGYHQVLTALLRQR